MARVLSARHVSPLFRTSFELFRTDFGPHLNLFYVARPAGCLSMDVARLHQPRPRISKPTKPPTTHQPPQRKTKSKPSQKQPSPLRPKGGGFFFRGGTSPRFGLAGASTCAIVRLPSSSLLGTSVCDCRLGNGRTPSALHREPPEGLPGGRPPDATLSPRVERGARGWQSLLAPNTC